MACYEFIGKEQADQKLAETKLAGTDRWVIEFIGHGWRPILGNIDKKKAGEDGGEEKDHGFVINQRIIKIEFERDFKLRCFAIGIPDDGFTGKAVVKRSELSGQSGRG